MPDCGRVEHADGLRVRMGCVRTCWVRRPANGLSADALVVSVKIKIKKLTGVVSVDTRRGSGIR